MRVRSELGPPAVAVVMGLWGVTVPSFWRDESVSAMAARMPLGDLWRLLGAIDAVHGLYYLLLRPFAAIGTSELVLRLPSVLATAAAAYGVAVLGRRLASERTGLLAGVIYALIPVVSRYAQETRSYALVSAVAVLATWALLGALEDRHWRRFAVYAVALALLGWLHLYALLLIPAHGVTVLAWNRHQLARWGGAVAGAVAAVVPLAVIASRERQQVAWLKQPGLHDLLDFPRQVGGTWWTAGVLGLLLAAGAVVAMRQARPLALVALPWAVLPVLLSFAISQAQPIYQPRYLLFCVPAAALLAGGAFVPVRALGTRSRVIPALAIGLLAVVGLPAQLYIRQPNSRPDDLRTLAVTLSAQEKPGDAVLFVPFRYRLFVGVYGRPYGMLDDLTYAPGHFRPRPSSQFRRLAEGFRRVWMVSPPAARYCQRDARCRALAQDGRFRRTFVQRVGRVWLALFTRR